MTNKNKRLCQFNLKKNMKIELVLAIIKTILHWNIIFLDVDSMVLKWIKFLKIS